MDNNEYKSLTEALTNLNLQKKVQTIPEVFGIEGKEIYITKWIGYILNNKEILTAFLCASDIDLNKDDIEDIKVYTEYVFDDGRRIDILIFTKKYLIGIENKIWSSEGVDQTSDYKDSLKKIANSKNLEFLGIYLHPEENREESNHFINITYNKLLNELKSTKPQFNDDFAKMMFDEFIKYVRECLCMSFPKKTEGAMLYNNYINNIRSAENEYNNYIVQFSKWAASELNKRSNKELESKIEKDKGKNRYYWIIVRSNEWRKIDFHFEVVWGENKTFFDTDTLSLEIHLEGKDKQNQPLKEHFEVADLEHGPDAPLEEEPLLGYDLSIQEKAVEAIEKIVEICNSAKFTKYADIADDYLKNNK